jgi:hypothetical protein
MADPAVTCNSTELYRTALVSVSRSTTVVHCRLTTATPVSWRIVRRAAIPQSSAWASRATVCGWCGPAAFTSPVWVANRLAVAVTDGGTQGHGRPAGSAQKRGLRSNYKYDHSKTTSTALMRTLICARRPSGTLPQYVAYPSGHAGVIRDTYCKRDHPSAATSGTRDPVRQGQYKLEVEMKS